MDTEVLKLVTHLVRPIPLSFLARSGAFGDQVLDHPEFGRGQVGGRTPTLNVTLTQGC
jgi:hypothetical protein